MGFRRQGYKLDREAGRYELRLYKFSCCFPFKVKTTLYCMGLILARMIGFNLTRGKFLTMSKSVGATSGLQIPFPCGLYGQEQDKV